MATSLTVGGHVVGEVSPLVSPGSRSSVGYSLDDPIALVDRRGLDEGSPLGRSIRDPPDRINSVEEACVERPVEGSPLDRSIHDPLDRIHWLHWPIRRSSRSSFHPVVAEVVAWRRLLIGSPRLPSRLETLP